MFDQEDCFLDDKCSKVSNFYVYKAYNYGVYFQTECSLELEDLVLVDNSLSIFPLVIYPDAEIHEYANKFVSIERGLIVGLSPSFDCERDVPAPEDKNMIALDKYAEGFTLGTDMNGFKTGRVGISFPMYLSEDNMAPSKTWHFAKVATAFYGKMDVNCK